MSFFRSVSDGLVLTVRAVPRASRNAVLGFMLTPKGAALKVAVTAPPDQGKANAAIIAIIAEAFGVAKRDVELLSGETDRRKVLRVTGNPATLTATAKMWMEV